MQSSLSALESVMKLICTNSKAHCEYESDDPAEWRNGCPACKTSKPPLVIDLTRCKDAGERPARRPIKSDMERSR